MDEAPLTLEELAPGRRAVGLLFGYQIVSVLLTFGGVMLARRHAGHSAVDSLALPACIVVSCLGAAALFAFRRERRRPGSVSDNARALAYKTVRIHAVIATLYGLAVAGPAILVLAPLVVLPSALIAYATTLGGLHLGARYASSRPR